MSTSTTSKPLHSTQTHQRVPLSNGNLLRPQVPGASSMHTAGGGGGVKPSPATVSKVLSIDCVYENLETIPLCPPDGNSALRLYEISDLSCLNLAVRNHSDHWLSQWHWVDALLLITAQLWGTGFIVFFELWSRWLWPINPWWGEGYCFDATFYRFGIRYITLLIVMTTTGRLTGYWSAPHENIATALTFILTRGKCISNPSTWVELVKIIPFALSDFIATMVSFAIFAAVTGGAVMPVCEIESGGKRAEFSPGESPICYSRAFPMGTYDGEASYAMIIFFTAMMMYAVRVVGERVIGWHYPNHLLSSMLYAAVGALVGAVWGDLTGGFYNYWFFVVSYIFTGTRYEYDHYFFWVPVLAVLCFMIFDVIIVRIFRREPLAYGATKLA